MAEAPPPWRGSAIHGFDCQEALDYSVANAGAQFSSPHEVCAKLMNGERYANPNPPADTDEHKDFEQHVMINQAYLDLKNNAQANAQGWLFYSDDMEARTEEKRVKGLKVSEEILLPTWEISAASHLLRRRVTLPPELVADGEPMYHFLQYKKLPNIGGPRRACILAGLSYAERLEEDVINARAAKFAQIAASVGEDIDPEDWAVLLANEAAKETLAQLDVIVDEYRSSEDEDYVPGSEASSDDTSDEEEVLGVAEEVLGAVQDPPEN